MATTVSMTNILANNGKGWFPAQRGNCTWQLSSITPGDGAASCDWYWPVAEPAAAAGMAVNAAAGAWTRLSAAFDRTSFADGSYYCRFDYNNNDGGNKTFWFTSCMLIDLTAAFGAGLEPSKEWLDKHITAFSDSPSVDYIYNLGELFTGISSAIQTKSGQSGKIFACDFIDKILAL